MSKSLLRRWFGRAGGEKMQADAQEHKRAGDALLGSGDYAGAEARYRAAIAAAPEFAPAHANLGYALHGQGRTAEAASAVRQALDLDAAQADAQYLAAVLARAEMRMADAERHYRLALQYAPAMEAACLDLCMLLAEQRRLDEALALARDALARDPDHAQWHFYLGNLHQESGRFGDAVASYRAALACGPDFPGLLNNFGLALLRQNEPGGVKEAAEAFGRLAALAPDSAEAHNSLGHALQRGGDQVHARAAFERAVALAPGMALARFNLGNTLLAQGDAETAAAQYEQALAADPAMVDAQFQLGVAQQELKRPAEALVNLRAVVERLPGHVGALARLGYLLHRQGEPEQAVASYRRALEFDPGHLDALHSLAILLQEMGDFPGSIALFERMLAQGPEQAEAHYNLGVSYESWARRGTVAEKLARYEQAGRHYRAAAALEPRRVDALLGLATMAGELMQLDEAIALYDRILAIDPEYPAARFNRGVTLLTAGRFAEGWRDFEYRFLTGSDMIRMKSDRPHWQAGMDIAGKTLMLYGEQGLGDCLQFVRYANLAAQKGATVVLYVRPPLKLLFASCPGVARVVSDDEEMPPHDYLCPMLSAPGIAGTDLGTIPADIPYLKAAPERIAHWRGKLGPRQSLQGLRVGLVWAGDPRKDQLDVSLVDRMRSLHFDQFRPLLEVPGASFYSLQVGPDTAAQLSAAQLTGAPQVVDHSGDLFDFQETAALAENLDLVICADTSTAHLVGAIGKPVWLLNRYNTCWRWLTERNDSPWYPTMRLFRQPRLGDWDSVIAEVKAALQAEANKAGSRESAPISN